MNKEKLIMLLSMVVIAIGMYQLGKKSVHLNLIDRLDGTYSKVMSCGENHKVGWIDTNSKNHMNLIIYCK